MPQTKKTTKRASKKKPGVLSSFNPQTGEVMAEIPAVDPAEVAEVVKQARKVAPEWGAIPIEGRARMLRQVRYRIYELMDEIVDTVVEECGKPRTEALAHDVLPPLIMLTHFERHAAKSLRSQRIGGLVGPLLGTSSRIEWRPFGVVGAITPWNYPVSNTFLAMMAPLFAGNVVVVKPSEVTPRCGELIRKIFDPLPSGVVSVIQGGGEVGAALVDAPCDKISFIGSPATGRKICETAARHLTPVVMELGGKDATIVLDDADIEFASSAIVWGAFFNAGQTCYSIERAFVHHSIAERFEDRVLTKLKEVRQAPDADLGTLTFDRQLGIVQDQVRDAIEKGAKVLAGGSDAGVKNENGTLWHAPTVLTGLTDDMTVLREETFGPILAITRVQDDEEAIRRVNEGGANLTASVWTKDRSRASHIADEVRAGTVAINDVSVAPASPWAPWGGVGESGFGRLNGELGLREFSVPVHVSRNLSPGVKKPFWYPYDEATFETFSAAVKFLGTKGAANKMDAVRSLGANIVKSIKGKI